jgi:hypothetical protein
VQLDSACARRPVRLAPSTIERQRIDRMNAQVDQRPGK